MSDETTKTIRVSPYARLPFDIFNYEHQMLIPEGMEAARDMLDRIMSNYADVEKEYGAFFAKLTDDPENPFKDTSFRIQLQRYNDDEANSELRDADRARQNIAGWINWNDLSDKFANAKGLLERYYGNDDYDDDELDDVSSTAIQQQFNSWLHHNTLLAMAKKSQVARYLVDNGKEHFWERVAEIRLRTH